MREPVLRGIGRQFPGIAGTAPRRVARRYGQWAPGGWWFRINSHDAFSHDSIDSLGYDWTRVANPNVAPVYPWKIYLPQTTEQVVAALQEVRQLNQDLKIRSKGHSSNGLVLTNGAVLLTEKLNKILEPDEQAMTVTVQAGAQLADIDTFLARRGLGLPIIGTHNHITAGGFAAVGGISAASHRFGLFVDNVERLEYVNWEGQVITCSHTENRDDFYRVLMSLGRYGVITTLVLRVIRVDKIGTILENDRTLCTSLDSFLESADRYIRDPADVQYARVLWADFQLPGGRSATGASISLYRNTDQTPAKRIRNALAYGALHRMGYVAGRSPDGLDKVVKMAGNASLLLSPRYASMKNVEIFLDKITDYTVLDHTRWIIVWTPLQQYQVVFREAYQLMREARERFNAFPMIGCDLRPFKSDYLSRGDGSQRFVDLVFEVGINLDSNFDEALDWLVDQIDDLCIRREAFRYMHSKTVKDRDRLRRIDPNALYAPGATPAGADKATHEGSANRRKATRVAPES